MPTGDPVQHTCCGGWWGIGPPPPCLACTATRPFNHFAPLAALRLSDDDVERIAQRVAELLKGAP